MVTVSFKSEIREDYNAFFFFFFFFFFISSSKIYNILTNNLHYKTIVQGA